jgi:hypothetical protein
MTAIEIIKKVRDEGFCIFKLPESLVQKIANSRVGDFSDGFHINNEVHLSIIKDIPVIKELEEEMRQEANQQKYDFNEIHVVRSVDSNSNERLRTHFDSHLYTIVLPSQLPDPVGEDFGQLYMVPCKRRRPSSDLNNLVSKLSSFLYRGRTGMKLLRRNKGYLEINLGKDEGIVFEGMVCLHGNKPNLTVQKRVTLISHYIDPFPKGAGALMRSIRKFFGTRK